LGRRADVLSRGDERGRQESTQLTLEANQITLEANQTQSVNVQLPFVYIEASMRGDKKLADFAYARFRPEARKAMDAWLQTDPFNNPNAPVRFFRNGGIRSTRERGSQACR
jgi:hypothetical protein